MFFKFFRISVSCVVSSIPVSASLLNTYEDLEHMEILSEGRIRKRELYIIDTCLTVEIDFPLFFVSRPYTITTCRGGRYNYIFLTINHKYIVFDNIHVYIFGV